MVDFPVPRPLRAVRPGRFSEHDTPAGLPRPLWARARFGNPLCVHGCAISPPLPSPLIEQASSGVLAIQSGKATQLQDFVQGNGSMQQADSARRLKLARTWVALAETLRADSEVLQSLPHLSGDQLVFLFMDRAASTLQRHISAWRQWSFFARASTYSVGSPSAEQVLDFLGALAVGAVCDRGSRRRGGAKEKVRSLKFLAFKLGLGCLRDILSGPVVDAWLAADKWEKRPPREALPLPLTAVAQLEMAISSCAEGDVMIIGCILMMVWGGLRWSDVQRLKFSSLVQDKDSIRAWTWRSKTSACGFPFGVLACGATRAAWGVRFGQVLSRLQSEQPDRDFLVASGGKPLEYAGMLAQFRRCLVQYCSLSAEQACRFSLHSCKATTLSWALQLDVKESWRIAQGHHKPSHKSAQKYGRDDVLPQLRCQKRLVSAIWRGWLPVTPLQRGNYPS